LFGGPNTLTQPLYGANAVAILDLNGDGKRDIAVSQWGGTYYWTNINGSTFSGSNGPSLPTDGHALIAANLTGFGQQLVAADAWNSVSDAAVLLSPSGPYTSYAIPQYAGAVASGDLNGDGKNDLAVGNSNGVSILLNSGGGAFKPAVNYNGASGGGGVAVADFDKDGKRDVLCAGTVYYGKGDGTLGLAVPVPGAGGPATVGDLDGDGYPDIITSDNTNVIVVRGGVTGFQPAVSYTAGTAPLVIALADFNGDGKLDVASGNWGSYDVTILLGDGAGGLGAPISVPLGARPTTIATGDLNGDGKVDLVVPLYNSLVIDVILNISQ
jgi:hypothetical protein